MTKGQIGDGRVVTKTRMLSDDEGSDGSDESRGQRIAAAATSSSSRKRQRGWQGGELEVEHQRQVIREDQADPSGKKKSSVSAAVDIRQFHNTQVGSGYQAKHVVRQPGGGGAAPAATTKVMPPPSPSPAGGGDTERPTKQPKMSKKEDKVTSYLQCQGLREFVREMNKILSA